MNCRFIGWRALPALLFLTSAFMNTKLICPSCHSETRRLIYCAISRRLVCVESCAMTDADIFLLELVQQQSTPTVAASLSTASDDSRK